MTEKTARHKIVTKQKNDGSVRYYAVICCPCSRSSQRPCCSVSSGFAYNARPHCLRCRRLCFLVVGTYFFSPVSLSSGVVSHFSFGSLPPWLTFVQIHPLCYSKASLENLIIGSDTKVVGVSGEPVKRAEQHCLPRR